jgi:hypothetical protein
MTTSCPAQDNDHIAHAGIRSGQGDRSCQGHLGITISDMLAIAQNVSGAMLVDMTREIEPLGLINAKAATSIIGRPPMSCGIAPQSMAHAISALPRCS